jgi:hypothetical protein
LERREKHILILFYKIVKGKLRDLLHVS